MSEVQSVPVTLRVNGEEKRVLVELSRKFETASPLVKTRVDTFCR